MDKSVEEAFFSTNLKSVKKQLVKYHRNISIRTITGLKLGEGWRLQIFTQIIKVLIVFFSTKLGRDESDFQLTTKRRRLRGVVKEFDVFGSLSFDDRKILVGSEAQDGAALVVAAAVEAEPLQEGSGGSTPSRAQSYQSGGRGF